MATHDWGDDACVLGGNEGRTLRAQAGGFPANRRTGAAQGGQHVVAAIAFAWPGGGVARCGAARHRRAGQMGSASVAHALFRIAPSGAGFWRPDSGAKPICSEFGFALGPRGVRTKAAGPLQGSDAGAPCAVRKPGRAVGPFAEARSGAAKGELTRASQLGIGVVRVRTATAGCRPRGGFGHGQPRCARGRRHRSQRPRCPPILGQQPLYASGSDIRIDSARLRGQLVG